MSMKQPSVKLQSMSTNSLGDIENYDGLKEELKNSGKKNEMIEKIAKGKIQKFISDNTLLNQVWIMDTKMKVSEVLKEHSKNKEISVTDFIRFKVGEGI